MGKGSQNVLNESDDVSSSRNKSKNNTFYSWSEVKKHNKKDDCWIVVNDKVYDLTNFKMSHPGGSRIISHYAGQDATVS